MDTNFFFQIPYSHVSSAITSALFRAKCRFQWRQLAGRSKEELTCSDEKARIGYLSCKICGQNFSADTDTLSQPIDVYSQWIDACEDVADNDVAGA